MKVKSPADMGRRSGFTWIAAIYVAAAIAIISCLGYIAFLASQGSASDRKYDEIAERHGYPRDEFRDIMRIKAKEAGNERDWKRLVEISKHSNPQLVQNSLGAFKKFTNSGHREDALKIVKAHTKSEDPFVRATALAVYWRMDAPDWRQVVGSAQSDSSALVSEWAATLLKEGDPKLSKGIAPPMASP